MNNHVRNITGILLAGGMSRRMGQDKGRMQIGHRFLYQYGLEVLKQVCNEIIISTCDRSDYFGDHKIACDDIPGIGPIGGISTCLKKSGTELNFILSYDLPLVSKELLQYLIGQIGNCDVIVPAVRVNRPEPLCGIYRKNVTEKLDRAIENKEYAVHSIFKMVKFKTVHITPQLSFYTPHLFLNVNTTEDLEFLNSVLKERTLPE